MKALELACYLRIIIRSTALTDYAGTGGKVMAKVKRLFAKDHLFDATTTFVKLAKLF